MASLFLHPLGLLALASVPLVLVLHLFHRRFQPRAVSAVFLWQDGDHAATTGRTIEPLRHSASLVLEVLAALLLALCVAGVRHPGMQSAAHLVVVLDGSASMAAGTVPHRACDRAIERVQDRIRTLPARALVTLLESGPVPRVLAGPAAPASEAARNLSSYEPSAPRHDLGATWSLALKLADQGQVLLVTDRYEPQAYPPAIELVAVGAALDNVAITRATRTPARGTTAGEVFLTIESFARQPVSARLTLSAARITLAERTVELLPEQPHHLSFEVPEDAPVLVAALGDDALAIDNRAVLARPPARALAIATTLPEATCRALELMRAGGRDRLERLVEMVPGVHEVADPGLAHLLLADSVVPLPGATWCVSIESSPGATRHDLVGPFLLDRNHALSDGLTLQGVVWSADAARVLDGYPVIAAGELPLLTDSQSIPRVLRINLDAIHSSLQRSPDWPILLCNLIEMRRAELPGPKRCNILVGEPFVYLDRDEASYVLEGEGQHLDLRARGTLVVDGLTRPGSYTLSRDRVVLCEIGVTFADAGESDLRLLGAGERAATAALATASADYSWLDVALMLAVLALLLGDWLVLARARRWREG